MVDDEEPGYRPHGIDDAFAQNRTSGDVEAREPGAEGAENDGTAQNTGSTTPDRPVVGTLKARGLLRFVWRQLTSMRVALMLLMLLAVAAVPGSVIPQRISDPAGYARYVSDNPELARWLDRFQVFDVYTSVWFSAIYLLLFISLVGCILPRTRAHLRGLRTPPPRAPRRFTRLPATALGRIDADADVSQVLEAARTQLRGRWRRLPRYRVVLGTEPDGARTLSAERGYLRETGNLVFHLALVGLLVSVATGQLLHYRGQVLVMEGRGFANAQINYDTFDHGAWFQPSSLDPFMLTLDSFESKFRLSDAQAEDFTAHVTLADHGTVAQQTIKVNHPLDAGGAKIYLQGNGYAANVTMTDKDGNTAFAGPVPFIPNDGVYTSQGTIKIPDVTSGDQVGLVGLLFPTGELVPGEGWRSVFPQPWNPVLVLSVWTGDLGLDDGIPQNVYELDTTKMTQALRADGTPETVTLRPGESIDLPADLGTLTFDGINRYVALDLRYDPMLTAILVFALVALAGLAVSLFVPRRRVWLRVRGAEVEVGALARAEDLTLEGEVAGVLRATGAEPYDDEGAAPAPVAVDTEVDAAVEAQEREPAPQPADRSTDNAEEGER